MDIIEEKINTLSEELDSIMSQRNSKIQEIQQLEIRMTQIIGALDVLREMLQPKE
jgi:hypothetical protein